MIIYNTKISKNIAAYNQTTPLQSKQQGKRSLQRKNLSKLNKEFLKSLNFKVKTQKK